MLSDAAAIKKNKDKKDVEVMAEEFRRKYNTGPEDLDTSDRVANLPNPVLYPLVDDDGDEDGGSSRTGLPQFDLIMRVDIQGKFQKEKSVMAFQNNFGNLPPRAMLEITEMVFSSSSMRGGGGGNNKNSNQDSVKLQRDIFLPEPKPVQPYSRLKMFRWVCVVLCILIFKKLFMAVCCCSPDEASMEGFQTAGCHAQYYTRMMQVNVSDKQKIQHQNCYSLKPEL